MKHRSEITAGIFLIIAFILFGASVFTLGREREIFAKQEHYYATFKDVKGLADGAPIRLGGITIGRVAKIGFTSDLNNSDIHLTLLLNEEYLERIRSDSVVTIESQGLLGDRFLAIRPGLEKNQLLPGSFIKSQDAADLSDIFNKAGNDLITPLHDALTDLGAVLKEVKEGQGLVHSIVYDKKGSDIITKLSDSANSIGELSKNISEISKEIKSGDGLLHELIYKQDKTSISQLLAKLDDTAANLKTTSQALKDGSGTLGALLVDSQLYDNLVEVTDGAKRSFILRQAIRSTLGGETNVQAPSK